MHPLRLVIASSCLATLFACSGGGGSSPTAPPPPPPPPPPYVGLTLGITVDLEAQRPLVLIRTADLVYDGSKINSISRCLDGNPFGCRWLRFTASPTTTRGNHTVDLRLVSQIFDLFPYSGSTSYQSRGKITVRDPSGVRQEIRLESRTVNLAPGDTVSYSIEVLP